MKLGFACPYYGATPPVVTISQLTAVMHVAWEHPWVATIATHRTGHIAACETILKRALLNNQIELLFWTEHDCILPIDAVSRLVKLAIERPEVEVFTGITFMRHPPYHPMIANHAGILTQELYDQERPLILVNGPDRNEPLAVNVGGPPIIGKTHYRFVTTIDTTAPPYGVDASSMNCLLFRRSALEKMAQIPSPFDIGHFTTPDFALFDRLRGKLNPVDEEGHGVLVDPALLTVHLGEQERIGFQQWVSAMETLIESGKAERLPDGSAA